MSVVVIGSIGMLTYPWLAAELFGTAALPVGLFLGTAIHDTSQVLGASLIFAQQFSAGDVVAIAGITKLVRNLSILVLVPLVAWVSRERSAGKSPADAGLKRSQVFPDFVFWFVVFVIVRTVVDAVLADSAAATRAWSDAVGASQSISGLFLVCGMTAVGLSISLRQVRGATSWRPLCLAVIVALVVAACSLALIHALAPGT
jgi:uncharacterized membrane protein YadS